MTPPPLFPRSDPAAEVTLSKSGGRVIPPHLSSSADGDSASAMTGGEGGLYDDDDDDNDDEETRRVLSLMKTPLVGVIW